MRSIRLAAFVPLLCFSLAAVTLHAQFKEPTKDELQMTAEPKAPGAAAVYLDYEDVRDQSSSTISFYERIKVLAEKGKEKATVTLMYYPDSEKMPEIVGRTIHADGTVIPMTEKAVSLVDLKTKGLQENKIVFTLPAVEVGSILEYRITEKWPDGVAPPTWYAQQDSFVRHEHFEFHSSSYYGDSYVARLPPGNSVQKIKGDRFALDMSDVAPVPDEDWMPPLNTLRSRVYFFVSDFKTQQEFWDYAGKRWAEALREVTKPTGKLKQAAASLVDPADTETVKAKKIYAAVMAMENTDFARQISEAERKKEKIKVAENVEDLWKLKRGSGDDLTLLFIALSRSAGLNVEPMRVTNRALAIFDPSVLNTNQLDDYIAVGVFDGKEVFLDPGQKMCPFGLLYWGHMVTYGMRYAGKGADEVRSPVPDYRQTGIGRTADLKVDETGSVQGIVRIELAGQDALHWRQLSLRNDESETRKQFNEWVQQVLPQGVQGEFDHFDGLDQYESPLWATLHVSGTVGTITGKRVFLPALFFEANAKHPFVSEQKRETPIDLHYPYNVAERAVYRLPEGYTLESGPQTTDVPWPQHAVLNIKVTTDTGTVRVDRTFAQALTILGASDYADLHGYFSKVAAADQQQIVLVRSTASKGQ